MTFTGLPQFICTTLSSQGAEGLEERERQRQFEKIV